MKTRIDCAQIEFLLPLYAGGDLEADEQTVVRLHLDSCPACCNLLGEFEASRQWLRALETPELAPLRIDLPQPARWLDRFAFLFQPRFAMASISFLIMILIGGYYFSRPRQQASPTITKETKAPTQPDTRQIEFAKPIGHPPDRRFAMKPKPFVPVPTNDLIIEGLDVPFENSPNTALAANAPEPEMLRIEFQTADPNIRIIWFAPKSNEALNNK